jgi:hypothetical protein
LHRVLIPKKDGGNQLPPRLSIFGPRHSEKDILEKAKSTPVCTENTATQEFFLFMFYDLKDLRKTKE